MPRLRSARVRVKKVTPRPKLDPRLAVLLSMRPSALRTLKTREDRLLADPDRVYSPLTAGLFFPSGSRRDPASPAALREPYASLFILSEASAADLARLGARVRSQSGDVFTAFVPLSRVRALEASPAVRYLELAHAVQPTLDKAVPYAQIDTLHGMAPSLDGAGVVVGVVDVYLDVYHPDFRLADGRTRVLWLWDQALTPQGQEKGPDVSLLSPMPFGGQTYGVEYDQTAIDKELKAFNPPNNYKIVRHVSGESAHGTKVAGVAAGNGLGQNKKFVGGAPAANIIFVRPYPAASLFTTDSATMADALAYVFARAEQLGQACVVNFSLGAYAGPRDGSRLVEQFFDSMLLTPGRAVTVAAMNDNEPSGGSARKHAMGTVPNGGAIDVEIAFGQFPGSNEQVEIWYSGQDTFAVTLTIKDQQLGIDSTIGPLSPGQAATAALPGGYTVTLTSVAQDPLNMDRVIYAAITVPPEAILPNAFVFRLEGTLVVNGTFHAWLSTNNDQLGGWREPYGTGDIYTLGIPGAAKRVLTVGNHDKSGPPPAIISTSGRGPTRDGRTKPDIATVGTDITTTRSRNMNLKDPGELYVTGITGTSEAAPLVAGACALLFQCRGATATWADLAAVLKATAAPMNDANAFGAGYMQMAAACAPPPKDVDVWLRDHAADTGAEPSVDPVWWLSPDIEVLDKNGNPVPNPKHDPNVPFNNIIRVTARNRGSQAAVNTDVYLYWADPATYLPFTVWKADGFFVNGPGFQTPGNRFVIPQIAPNGSAHVDFAWAPPAPGSNLLQDAHFCLVARLENAGDPSAVGPGGWDVIAGRNNVALRNVYVQQSPATITFYVPGTGDQDTLIVTGNAAGGRVELSLPVQALPWRSLRLLQRLPQRRAPYGCCPSSDDPLATMSVTLDSRDAIRMTTGIVGATALQVRHGVATIVAEARATVVIPDVRVAPGARMPVRLAVSRPRATTEQRDVHVAQLSGGRRVGGVTLRLALAATKVPKTT